MVHEAFVETSVTCYNGGRSVKERRLHEKSGQGFRQIIEMEMKT